MGFIVQTIGLKRRSKRREEERTSIYIRCINQICQIIWKFFWAILYSSCRNGFVPGGFEALLLNEKFTCICCIEHRLKVGENDYTSKNS